MVYHALDLGLGTGGPETGLGGRVGNLGVKRLEVLLGVINVLVKLLDTLL